MKSKLLVIPGLLAMLAFGSCKENWDDSPVLNGHEGTITANFLNKPAMQDQYLMLSTDNQEGYLHLTCSQPDFGYAAIATYKVQVSLNEAFPEDEYVEISQAFYDCAEINPLNKDVAAAIEKCAGIEDESQLPLDYTRVYVRLRAYIEQSPDNTQYLSNVVYFEHIGVDYFARWIAGKEMDMYLRGSFDEGWNALPEYQFVTGEEENTYVITHEVTLTAGTEFKVADAAWGPLNLGAGDDGNVVKINTPYTLAGGDNPGNLTITEDFTGTVHLTEKAGTYTLILETGSTEN